MAMAIPQRPPWYIMPLRFLRAMFQIKRFPGLALAILVFLLVIPSLFAEWVAPHDPIKGAIEAMTIGHRLVVLDGGKVQQVGAPMDLYRTPANRFVAVQIMAEIVIASRSPVTVERDHQQRADEHDPIDPAHEK